MEKIWLRSYQPGCRLKSASHRKSSVSGTVRAKRGAFSRSPVCSYGAQLTTDNLTAARFRQLSAEFARLATGDAHRPDDAQHPAVSGVPVRALRAGYVVVNCNPLYTARELEHQLKDSGAEAIVVLRTSRTRWRR